MLTIWCISFSVLCVAVGGSYLEQDEGSFCQQLGLRGTCMKVEDCPIALEALRKKRRHDLLTCGFDKLDEIVCCPNLADRNPTIESTTLDKSTIWSNENTVDQKNETITDPHGRIQLKRKCEKMCEKMRKDYNIRPGLDYHILNGETASLGQFPHMVALGYAVEDDTSKLEWRCGATLVSAKFLLTAAHCFVCIQCSNPVKARFGVVNIDTDAPQDVDVKDSIPHPNYNITTKHNDIAVIELVKEVLMSQNVYPACLYAEGSDPPGLRISGWGQTDRSNSTSRSITLQHAVIEPVPVAQCNLTIVSANKFSAKVIVESQICAISNSDACVGDSGGPLQIEKKEGGFAVVGIISYGLQCGSTAPGIYTRVSSYLDWIERTIWPD